MCEDSIVATTHPTNRDKQNGLRYIHLGRVHREGKFEKALVRAYDKKQPPTPPFSPSNIQKMRGKVDGRRG